MAENKQRNDKEYEKFYKHSDWNYYIKVVIVSGDPNNPPPENMSRDDLEDAKFVETPYWLAVRLLSTTP
jgi:hypothetical protein